MQEHCQHEVGNALRQLHAQGAILDEGLLAAAQAGAPSPWPDAVTQVFTWALARSGQWIEERDAQFKAMAATLRGAAIGLLPVNFMAIALLSGDPDVSRKGLAVPVMALLYLGLFAEGVSLRLLQTPRQHGAESFLGFALVLLGLLMGAAEPKVRSISDRS